MNNGYAAMPIMGNGTDALATGMSSERTAMMSQVTGDPVFGLQMCKLTHDQVADLVLKKRRRAGEGMALVATANIQHIAIMRRDPEFRSAMQQADLVTCDGFPVFRYANYRGCDIHVRTTGREIVQAIMCKREIGRDQRMYFVVDSEETRIALEMWALKRGLKDQICVEVPPLGFISDAQYCEALAERISLYSTSLLFLCVGAPQSEIFAHRWRRQLPPCWTLCVGQSAKIVLGLAPIPPRIIETLSVEWLWRIALEPKRLIGRYATCSVGFLAAMKDDMKARQTA